MTEAEARAALRASVGAGHVGPWIAQQAWEQHRAAALPLLAEGCSRGADRRK